MNQNSKKLLFFLTLVSLSIPLLFFGFAFYQMNEAAKESCFASLSAFLQKELENQQLIASAPIDENWRVLTKQESQILLNKAVQSKSLDCPNIRRHYSEGDYWGKDLVISIRTNKSTQKFEMKIDEE
jgi:hypothetical protein